MSTNGPTRQSAGTPPPADGVETAAPETLPAFEEALGQLEETVAALESGELPLEAALAIFERGMRLAHVCQQVLDRAQLRVRHLLLAEEGELRAERFDEQAE
jgi:exodeoxyribonuclease VII small subunit